MHEMGKLKEVSKVKHTILRKYFPAWARILGSNNSTLVYVDCFAGAGQYDEGEPGSPVIILRTANELAQHSSFSLRLFFVERDQRRADILREILTVEQQTLQIPSSVTFHVIPADARDFTDALIGAIPKGMPAFFFIDPYGHPIPIPLINRILSMRRKEVLLVLMWFALNMHLNNPRVHSKIDEMFGHGDWVYQSFMYTRGKEREHAFLDYFTSQVQAAFVLPFRILFSPEDKVPGGQHRTKYYILHFSNHVKAALLMKEVMWPLGDEEGTFAYSATRQQRLFSLRPSEEELACALLETFQGRTVSFQRIREETWYWPYLEKHYRQVIKMMEARGIVEIQRKESKKSGLRGKDIVKFPANRRHGG